MSHHGDGKDKGRRGRVHAPFSHQTSLETHPRSAHRGDFQRRRRRPAPAHVRADHTPRSSLASLAAAWTAGWKERAGGGSAEPQPRPGTWRAHCGHRESGQQRGQSPCWEPVPLEGGLGCPGLPGEPCPGGRCGGQAGTAPVSSVHRPVSASSGMAGTETNREPKTRAAGFTRERSASQGRAAAHAE